MNTMYIFAVILLLKMLTTIYISAQLVENCGFIGSLGVFIPYFLFIGTVVLIEGEIIQHIFNRNAPSIIQNKLVQIGPVMWEEKIFWKFTENGWWWIPSDGKFLESFDALTACTVQLPFCICYCICMSSLYCCFWFMRNKNDWIKSNEKKIIIGLINTCTTIMFLVSWDF